MWSSIATTIMGYMLPTLTSFVPMNFSLPLTAVELSDDELEVLYAVREVAMLVDDLGMWRYPLAAVLAAAAAVVALLRHHRLLPGQVDDITSAVLEYLVLLSGTLAGGVPYVVGAIHMRVMRSQHYRLAIMLLLLLLAAELAPPLLRLLPVRPKDTVSLWTLYF